MAPSFKGFDIGNYLQKHRWALVIGMSVACLFAFLILVYATFLFDFLERKSIDLRFVLRGVSRPSGNVAVCMIEEESIRQLGRWPWSRRVIADLLLALKEYGVRAIGFDILFIDPEVSPDLARLKALSDSFKARGLLKNIPANQAYFKELQSALKAADHDAQLAAVITESDNVVLSMAFLPGPEKKEPMPKVLEKAAYDNLENPSEFKNLKPAR